MHAHRIALIAVASAFMSPNAHAGQVTVRCPTLKINNPFKGSLSSSSGGWKKYTYGTVKLLVRPDTEPDGRTLYCYYDAGFKSPLHKLSRPAPEGSVCTAKPDLDGFECTINTATPTHTVAQPKVHPTR